MATVIPDIFEGDVGTHFVAEIKNLVNSEAAVPLDISTASLKKIIFKLPDETEKEFDGVFVTDGTDGALEYVTDDVTDLVMIGTDAYEQWEYYAFLVYPGGQRRTSTIKFRLYKGRLGA